MTIPANYVEPLSSNKLIQDITFANEAAGDVTVFTVTGDVIVKIIPVITTSLTSVAGANVSFGIVGIDDAFIVNSPSTGLDQRGIWVDQTPDNEAEPLDRMREYIITDGNNIILNLDAQIDAGVIRFYCFWIPLSSDGKVA